MSNMHVFLVRISFCVLQVFLVCVCVCWEILWTASHYMHFKKSASVH